MSPTLLRREAERREEVGLGISLPIGKKQKLAFKIKLIIPPVMVQMMSSFNLRHSDQREFDWLNLEILFLNGKLGYSSGKFNSGQCFQVQVSFQVFVQQNIAKAVCRKCCHTIPGFYGIPLSFHMPSLTPPNPYTSLCVY